ncbi:hypothetical protein MATR_22910 [Marivirga tractuosa]|uniref:Polysaccharide biosynthesis protein n=1 Tax=Marivirga tractuosa (strain ATCC 23168 / DSM 4126 / NBRC 15989 / NCIMB 1408 / VKM B-1430 / H-43) TaxID=643867 RepID=E4TVG5_MARTH|nr:hypothetical protein [Marivirga tractuosa]ADR20097.1 hypothetical protein Ftrac_0083 [Marivirga tractuosa DSM 4126]BDD15466.1 hypothetical protein MATR_22910 [Marivirga tractuosa]
MLKYWTKYQHSIWSGLLLMIRTLAGFGAQKVVAIFYGPAGTTLFSHFQNFVALFAQPIQDAVANGLINAFPKKSLKNVQVVGASIILLILLAFCSGLFLFISGQFGASIFSFSLSDWLLIIPSILLFCFGLIIAAVYVIQKKLRLYSIILLIQWSIFFFSISLIDLQLHQFLIYWLIIQSLFTFFLIIPVYSLLKFNFKIEEKVKNHFKQFLIMALVIWLSSKWVNYFVREFSIQEFGVIQTGFWQSIVRVSEAYRGLMISFLFLTLYPFLSRKMESKELKVSALMKKYLYYSLISLSFLFLVFQFDALILKILYDEQYVKASNLFQLQIIGDFFAFLAFPFSIYLIASIQTKVYVITELLSAIIFVTLITLKSTIGIEVLVYAHIVRFTCYSIMVGIIGIKKLRDAF